MKLTILILLFFTTSGFCQEIKYNLFVKDSCSNQIEKSLYYYLEKNGTIYEISDFDATVLLPTKGEYKLIASELDEEYNIVIDKLINSDTLYLPKIVEMIIWPPFSFKAGLEKRVEKEIRQSNLPTFWVCDKKCEGKLTDHYSNGSIRISGNFVNGLPVGELKKYYKNGIIKEVSLYDADGFLIHQTLYTENGEIIKE